MKRFLKTISFNPKFTWSLINEETESKNQMQG